MHRLGVPSLAALLALVPAAAWAQKVPVPLGPPFQVNANVYYDYNQGIFGGPEVAADGAGNFIVVWEGDGNTAGRRFSTFGQPLGGNFEFQLPSSGYSYTDSPVVSADPDGDFVVAWEETYDQPYRIAAQRYSSSGAALGAAFQVNAPNPYEYFIGGPEVSHVGTGGDFVVVWGGFVGNYAYPNGVFGQRFDSAGTRLGSQFQVNSQYFGIVGYTGYDDPDGIGLAGSANGTFVVAWHAYYPAGEYDLEVFARRFDSAGAPAGGDFQVNTAGTSSPFRPAVATDGAGGFVVVWTEYYPAIGRRYDSTGAPIGSEFQINTLFGATLPKVAADTAGSFMVAWRDAASDSIIVGRQFDSTGAPAGAELEVTSPGAFADVWEPDIAATGPNEFVVVWAGLDDYTGDFDVFARRIGDAVACSTAPKTTCREQTAPRGVFRFTQATDIRRSRLTWRWAKGEETMPQDYGDPLTDTDYALCVYDTSADPQPILSAFAPAHSGCPDVPCWRILSGPGPTVEYIDAGTEFGRNNNPDGVRRVRLRPGAEGRAIVLVEGRGENLSLPDLPLSPPVTVQLQASTDECWTAVYNQAGVRANGDGRFRARPGP